MDLQSPDKKMSKSLPPAGCVNLLDEPVGDGEEDPLGGHRHRARGGRRPGEQAGRHQPADHPQRAVRAEHRRARGALRRPRLRRPEEGARRGGHRLRHAGAGPHPRSCSTTPPSSSGCSPPARRGPARSPPARWPRSTSGSGFLAPAAGVAPRERRHLRPPQPGGRRAHRARHRRPDPRAVGAAARRLAREGRRPAGQRGAAARDAAAADRGGRRRPAGDQRPPGRGRPLPPAVRDAPVGHRHLLAGVGGRVRRPSPRASATASCSPPTSAAARWRARCPSRTTRTSPWRTTCPADMLEVAYNGLADLSAAFPVELVHRVRADPERRLGGRPRVPR